MISLCSFAYKIEKQNEKANKNSQKTLSKPDSIIVYNLEGFSSEGAEAKAKYHKSKILECVIFVYGETGQSKIIYKFRNKQIFVNEYNYLYTKSISEIKNKSEIKLSSTRNYVLDYQGNFIGKTLKKYMNIFEDIKKNVLFELS